MSSLLLATGGGSLGLSNTSDLLDSALDFLSLLSSSLGSLDVAVLYNTPLLASEDLYNSRLFPSFFFEGRGGNGDRRYLLF